MLQRVVPLAESAAKVTLVSVGFIELAVGMRPLPASTRPGTPHTREYGSQTLVPSSAGVTPSAGRVRVSKAASAARPVLALQERWNPSASGRWF